jgi:hypothetical protein
VHSLLDTNQKIKASPSPQNHSNLPDHSISNVFLVDSLDYNLLSVSQLCKMGHNCLFTDIGVTVFRRSDDSITFKGVLESQLYLVDFNENTAELNTCLIAKTNMG